ncbi:LANO_0B08130g1_1 [Lachancea nothofagi CBS 11611]|uniref:LANO_0B08130g1_1 n=1 Tax=Lachancea nothofagi CBS 11611 TaxID=1266666 RepID=A0A1G4J103_9SACH|nr:LANO_0B08130g1_1 [Lachancea nothofagi CBS 11611]
MPDISNTEEYSSILPRLPVPPLKESLRRYVERLEPLQSPQNHAKTKSTVFSEDSLRLLSELNQELIEYDQELQRADPASSYIEQFWYDAYLQFDESVVLNINPFFELQDDPTLRQLSDSDPFGEVSRLVTRSSRLVLSTLSFIKEIRCKTLKPDTARGTPLSMDQYEKLFGSARIPPDAAGNSCRLQTSLHSTHIVVLYKSTLYWFDVLDFEHNPVFSAQELECTLFSIIKDADTNTEQQPRFPWGALTTENRSTWSNIRDYISRSPITINSRNLQIIDSALFVLCLDNVVIDDPVDLVQEMLCGTSDVDLEVSHNDSRFGSATGVQRGTCLNRWYDKLQLIVTRNGKAGINFEHTGVDGHTVLRLATHIYTDSILQLALSITKPVSVYSSASGNAHSSLILKTPRKLEWQMDSYLLASLHFAETRVSDLISQFEFARLDFVSYGSLKIKSVFKVSPDAFVQMGLQAAYHSLYGKFEVTYEPAMTKQFQNGRTEAVRSVSHESKRFVESFNGSGASKTLLKSYLSKACERHSFVTKECAAGMGQDRHLYALYCIWKESFRDTMPKPLIFEDGGWNLLQTSVISTSNCGNPSLQSFGFGPVCANGFGIGYIMRDKSISIVVSSKHRQTTRLVHLIERFFHDIERVYISQD